MTHVKMVYLFVHDDPNTIRIDEVYFAVEFIQYHIEKFKALLDEDMSDSFPWVSIFFEPYMSLFDKRELYRVASLAFPTLIRN